MMSVMIDDVVDGRWSDGRLMGLKLGTAWKPRLGRNPPRVRACLLKRMNRICKRLIGLLVPVGTYTA
jgi:hypothetical protein